MTKPIFGQPPAAPMHPYTEQATIVARAIQALEMTREYNSGGDSTAVLFVRESWVELTELLGWFYAQGVNAADVDYGGFPKRKSLPMDGLHLGGF